MRPEQLIETVEIPSDVQATKEDEYVTVKGPKGEVKKLFNYPKVEIKVEEGKFTITSIKPTKKEKAVVLTYRAHLRNMVNGVNKPYKYELSICSTHFPMNVTYGNNALTVKNFYGEKHPRVLKISDKVKLNVKDKTITIESPDIEAAGTTAANIEQLTRITNKDLRIFQDGIYIVNKAGKELK